MVSISLYFKKMPHLDIIKNRTKFELDLRILDRLIFLTEITRIPNLLVNFISKLLKFIPKQSLLVDIVHIIYFHNWTIN